MRSFGFRSTFKSMFNFKTWMSWSSIAQNGKFIKDSYTQILKNPKKVAKPQTFEEALERYNYDSDFLDSQKARFLLASRIYLAFMVVGIIYGFWLLSKKYYLAASMMVPFNFMLFSFYFKESFWYMQICQRRLGMSFKDWVNFIVLGNG